jgi:hypothetical protein
VAADFDGLCLNLLSFAVRVDVRALGDVPAVRMKVAVGAFDSNGRNSRVGDQSVIKHLSVLDYSNLITQVNAIFSVMYSLNLPRGQPSVAVAFSYSN